jgi:small-conductance mechanosensitive channel
MKNYWNLLSILLLFIPSTDAFSEDTGTTDDAVVAEPEVTQVVEVSSETWRTFETLFDIINHSKKDLAELRTKLGAAKSDADREVIRNDIALLQSNIESLQTAWEMWATGGVDMELFLPKKEEKFDWRQEIQSVFEPIVVELQRLTERPRKIERFRTEQAFYQQQLDAASAALKHIEDYKRKAASKDLQGAFSNLESNWRKRHDGIKSRLTLINLQLEDLLSTDGLVDDKTSASLKELLIGRLVNLLLALLAASLTYGVLRMINRLYVRLITRSGRQRPFLARAAHLSFILLSVILALLAAIVVLYLRGDRILLGLMLIALVGAVLTLQRTLPGFISEARVLLNIGSVREGQRIVYNGLPWKVQSLNVYSTLVNPELCGGKLLLPLRALTELNSRPYDESEPWFPTRENDYVLLSDQTYGRVVLQTPEMVQLRVLESERTYPVAAFLGNNPQNLSRHGFAITVKFGVDYQHQAMVTGEIKQKFENYLVSHLKESKVGGFLNNCFVEFDEAAASSLNLFIYASFTGDAADSYFRIRRTLQSLAVDACNTNGWVIPFNQVTVHLAQEGQSVSY